jgi:hypothetical protein
MTANRSSGTTARRLRHNAALRVRLTSASLSRFRLRPKADVDLLSPFAQAFAARFPTAHKRLFSAMPNAVYSTCNWRATPASVNFTLLRRKASEKYALHAPPPPRFFFDLELFVVWGSASAGGCSVRIDLAASYTRSCCAIHSADNRWNSNT